MIQSQRVSLERFFLTVTVECGVLISSLEHFFLSLCFLAIFSLSRVAFLSSETNCSRFVSFVSRKRKKFRLLSFEDHQFGCFQTKIKSSDECAQRKAVAYHRLIDFALFVCACVRERVREQRVHDLIQLF
jgi:hypothetical protein